MASRAQWLEPFQYPRPIWRVTVGGEDVTARVRPRLRSLSMSESRADEADQLDLVLDDHDGRLALPARGVTVQVLLGWEETGLVDKGTFEVDEVQYEGPPDTITLRARSADLTGALRTRTARSFHDTTLAAIVQTIAQSHGLEPVVGSFGPTAVAHVDQSDESDLAFLNRIGKRYDAVATVKSGRLLFLPIGQGQAASGQDMPTLTLSRRDGDRMRFQLADRDNYSGVRAAWQDKASATRQEVRVGRDDNALMLRATHASRADAHAAAQAEWARIQREGVTMEMDLAYGRPDLSPQMKLRLQGVKAPFEDYTWLIVKLTHTLNENGLTSQVQAETAESAEARARKDAEKDDVAASDASPDAP